MSNGSQDHIEVRGAKTHNLKDINVDVPKGALVAFTGVSGSGKSSLAFDTIYIEAQRQLIETFSSFARQRLPKLSRPPVDSIGNLSTAIVIDQKPLGRTLRSTVGTATEANSYLRILYSRFGSPEIGPSFYFGFNHPEGMCPVCKGLGTRIQLNAKALIAPEKSIREGAIEHPDWKVGGWNWREVVASDLFDPDKPITAFTDEELNRLLYAEAIPFQKKHGAGTYAKTFTGAARRLEEYYVNRADAELPDDKKTAYDRYLSYSRCNACDGTRLNERARSVHLQGNGLADILAMEVSDLKEWLTTLSISGAEPLVEKTTSIVKRLYDIGAGYLSLDRTVATLSGGESQRVKMARQMDCDLVDLSYIMDEPSVGLHPCDVDRVVDTLHGLRDRKNTVLVVEHDVRVISEADWIIELGPAAGADGGEILYAGTVEGIMNTTTPTGVAMGNTTIKTGRRRPWSESFPIRNANTNNLKDIDIDIPKNIFTCITGVAGSGKSTLIHTEFTPAHEGTVVVDQTAIGKSSRSTPASYVGIFDLMRKELSTETGVKAGMFSFNSTGGCKTCKGSGFISIEMSFLDDVKMTCGDCEGKRYQSEALHHRYQGKNINEILTTTIDDTIGFFTDPEINRRLQILNEVGLGYLELGQPISSLSGGETQRIKLANRLKDHGTTFIMDEPTSGLHPQDVVRLVTIINRLVDAGNTVIVIEHDLTVIAQADWVIDLGPGGGKHGGLIMAEGTPEEITTCESSLTGQYLGKILDRRSAPDT